jgi:hypothetical protein
LPIHFLPLLRFRALFLAAFFFAVLGLLALVPQLTGIVHICQRPAEAAQDAGRAPLSVHGVTGVSGDCPVSTASTFRAYFTPVPAQ